MLRFRSAGAADLEVIVRLLANDPLGRGREDPGDLTPYRHAFEAIDADPAHTLWVAELEGRVVGVLQTTLLPNLSRGAATRLQIEGVRVDADTRGRGVGRALMNHAIEEGRRAGARWVQLTSDRTRTEAQAFYEGLGFEATHVGYKLRLDG